MIFPYNLTKEFTNENLCVSRGIWVNFLCLLSENLFKISRSLWQCGPEISDILVPKSESFWYQILELFGRNLKYFSRNLKHLCRNRGNFGRNLKNSCINRYHFGKIKKSSIKIANIFCLKSRNFGLNLFTFRSKSRTFRSKSAISRSKA